MRILVCNWRDLRHPAAGGAEVYTEEVLRRWAAAGHEVTLFSAAVDGVPAEEVAHGVHHVRRGGRLGVYREARRWYAREGRGRYDVVVDETNTVPFLCHEWVDDAPVVAFIHQTCEEIWFHQMPVPVAALGRYVLEPRWMARYRDVPTLTVSESSRASLARFGLRDIEILPEGFTPPEHLPAVGKEARPTLLFVGRMVTYKQPFDVLAAYEVARRSVPGLQLWFVGGGPLEDRLRKAAPDGVTVFGHVSAEEKVERMARAHALAVTSVREGWGLVVAEAAALGTRSIAYDAPGLRDAVRAAEGVLVPPRPEALGAWIASVLPRWQAAPPPAIPYGGVRSWDEVAVVAYDRLMAAAGLDRRGGLRAVA